MYINVAENTLYNTHVNHFFLPFHVTIFLTVFRFSYLAFILDFNPWENHLHFSKN